MAASDTQVDGNHYQENAIPHHEYVRVNKIPWHESNAIKYTERHKRKNGIKDIAKAIHYLLMMTELEYPEEDRNWLESSVRQMLD